MTVPPSPSPPPSENSTAATIPCRGLPQLVSTTDELLPIILGTQELTARQCIVCNTEQMPGARLREALWLFRVEVLNPHDTFVLSPFDAGHNAGVGRRVAELARERGVPALAWNYTPGTKQMFLGLYRGLNVEGTGSVVRDMFYLDTSQPRPLWFSSESEPRALETRLAVDDILHANGWLIEGALRLRRTFDSGSLPNRMEPDMRRWISAAVGRGQLELLGDMHQISAGPGDWISFHVADALLRNPLVKEVWCGIKVAPFQSAVKDGREQDIDIAVAIDNTLIAFECKWEKKPKAEELLKLAQIARSVGGRKSVPIYLVPQPRSGLSASETGMGRKGSHHGVGVVYWDADDPATSTRRLEEVLLTSTGRAAATLAPKGT